ncbi:MAG TPA: DUF5671 domain-containing protein [Propionibacteriaceae bacterium]|nr:DUF5671 domain-containing protein [Propionibacteriaceae bacterium]
MIVSLVVGIALIVAVVLVARRFTAGAAAGGSSEAHAVRRFFQYLLLYGLLMVVGVGVSGLLGRLFDGQLRLAGDEAGLARDLAFTVVGIPLFAGVALWSRSRFRAGPEESRSLGWAFYVTAASVTALVFAMTGLGQVLEWAFGLSDYSGRSAATVVVWGGLWAAHWWLGARVTPPEHVRLHHLVGSLIGLATAATGLVGVLGAALRTLLGLQEATLVTGQGSPILRGLAVLLVGAPVWVVYWYLTARRDDRHPLWWVYVLLAGVAGGLVMAITAASTLLYSVLVWLVGDPGAADARTHFQSAPTAAATAAVGVLLWWYHQAVLRGAGQAARTEVRRVYEYLMAGIALLAGAAGLTVAVVALIEALAGNRQVLVGNGVVNTLLAAFTLLIVGGPVWWIYWRLIHEAADADPAAELMSTTRRVYLFVLFGVGGIAAVISLLVGVYMLFEDVVNGVVGAETLRRMRVAIGVLLATAAISAYHWTVYRSDRKRAPSVAAEHEPRYVLLVGPADREVAREVAHRTHGRVQVWSRTDDGAHPWSADDVMAALDAMRTDRPAVDEVIVLSDAEGLRAIPVHRG